LDPGGSAVGFHVIVPFQQAGLVELTRADSSSPVAASRAERFFHALGKHVAWVGDAPGLVLGRIVCQVVNECAFALGEGVGSAQDIDTGMTLGLNYPRGPLAWADSIGLDHVVTVLEALCEEYREERYRPAPALQRLVRAGRLGRAAGAGFFDHDLKGGRRLTSARERTFSSCERRATAVSTISRHPPRTGVAPAGRHRRPRRCGGMLSGDVHRRAARLPAA